MKKHFLAGLAILLPVMIVLWAIFSLIGFLTEPFVDGVSHVFSHLSITSHPGLTRFLSQCLILILLFFSIALLGLLARTFLMSFLFKLGDFFIQKIPLFNTIYKTTREIIDTLFSPNRTIFKTVVLVPFPHPDSYAIGLISRDAPQECSSETGEKLISVFIPTTPNPTTGFLLMFPEKSLMEIPLSPEDAFKYVLSCGVITPHQETPS